MSTQPSQSILKQDPRFAEAPDFRSLRQRGIEHIAALSGDLWTDHNLHDPGITLLELLCYALTDLGYRTSLDEAELFAPTVSGGTDGNFFTPAEILTNNPVTVLDYRKMLVDIPGVRNAWIEKADAQEVPLYYRVPTKEDCKPRPLCTEVNDGDNFAEVRLNGLYRVLLDMEPVLNSGDTDCRVEHDSFGVALAEVNRRLHAHRNLCEDFLEVAVLRDEEIGFCLDLELAPKADPAIVLADILEAIERFISPRPRFASLRTLLTEGKPMEEIYRGRPYLPQYESDLEISALSHGFVDTEQLASLTRPTVLRTSDLYRVIMNVVGVRAIRELKLANFLNGIRQTEGEDWTLPLTPGHRPIFAPERGTYKFSKGQLRVPFDPSPVFARFRRRLGDYRKITFAHAELDLAIPYGNHRADLGNYYSIQHELPVVYGVGEGDLSSDAPPARRTQVLQLRGFLSFFDQFLANYCTQLFNTREVFSWRRGAGKTIFGSPVSGAPGGAELLRFPATAVKRTGATPVIVRSLTAYDHPLNRDQAVASLIQEFRALSLDALRARLRVETEGTDCYQFIINDSRGSPILRGELDYRHEASAIEAGNQAILQLIYQGGVAGNYRAVNYPADHLYGFTIVDGATDYATFLDSITESPKAFAQNRNAILDHLLARFNESFTDYVLLMYALNQAAPDPEKLIADKERFLAAYPKISRERGKGFNYLRPEATDNRSGLEQRIGYLTGLEKGGPSHLNPFSVHLRNQRQRLIWLDHRGRVLLRSRHAYPLDADIPMLTDFLLERLGEPTAYQRVECATEGIYRYFLSNNAGSPLADFPATFASATARDASLACTWAYFSDPWELTISVKEASGAYEFTLDGTEMVDGIELVLPFWRSEQSYLTGDEARSAAQELLLFVRTGKSKIKRFALGRNRGYGLRLVMSNRHKGAPSAIYVEVVDTLAERAELEKYLNAYHDALTPGCVGMRLSLKPEKKGYYFALPGPNGEIWLRTPALYPDEAAARLAGLKLLTAARQPAAYQHKEMAGRFGFDLVDNSGEIIGDHPITYDTAQAREDKLAAVWEYFSRRVLDFRFLASADRFFWRIQAGNSGALLRGTLPFPTTAGAKDNWLFLREKIVDSADWRVEKGPTNSWWVKVFRTDGLLLAESGPYPDETLAQTARTELREWIGLGIAADVVSEELAGEWFFHLWMDSREVLRGTRGYTDRAAAEWAALLFGKWAGTPEHYRDRPDPDGCLLSFVVVDESGVIAGHPNFLSEQDANALRERVIAHVADNYVECTIGNRKFSWTYCINWEACNGCCEPLLVSTGEGWDTAIAAKTAARKLLHSLKDGTRLENWINGGKFSFGVSEEGMALAEHPRVYPTEAERDAVRADALNYLGSYYARCDGSATGFTREDELFVHCKSLPVCCAEMEKNQGPAGADSVLSAYRLSDAEAVAVHPVSIDTAAARNNLIDDILSSSEAGALDYIEFRVAFARSGTLQNRYHYEWAVPGLPSLRSVRSFASEAEAEAGFENDLPWLLRVAPKARSYSELILGEVLDLLYAACWPDDAGSFTAYRPGPFGEGRFLTLSRKDGLPIVYLPVEGEVVAGTARRAWQSYTRHYPFRYTEGLGWSYHLIKPAGNAEWLRSTGYYPDRLRARRAFSIFLELVSFRPNYRTNDNPEAGIYRLAITETLLEASITYADSAPGVSEDTPCPVICPAEYTSDRYPVGEGVWPVFAECPDKVRVNPLCPRAWSEGLETFLLYGTKPENYYDFLDAEADCRHGFRVVRDGYRLARSPRESHTPLEREKLLDWLYSYSNCGLKKAERPYIQCVSFGAGAYRPALRPENATTGIDWLATDRFDDKQDAEAYWASEMIPLLGHAQEPDFYQATKGETDPGGTMRYRLEVLDQAGEVVLESAELFYREDLPEVVRARVARARSFPLYRFRDNFGFQCFSTIDIPDFIVPSDSPCLPADLAPSPKLQQDQVEITLFGGVLELNVRVPGEVVWESAEEFATADDAWAAYRCFERLLADRRNYQRKLLSDCNLFGLELTRPDRVLAENPRRYGGMQALTTAREHTLARINGEGMRLIEHLLLRPREASDKTIPNVCPTPPPAAETARIGCPDRDHWPAGPDPAPAGPLLVSKTDPFEPKKSTVDELPYVAGADPYSQWATIILPYWPYRFQNVNFRAFFEDSLRREAPAHVALKICWLDPKQMREFERRYHRWLKSISWEAECGRGEAQNALIGFLAGMTSVYPPARLQGDDCHPAGATEAGAVLLGSTQLS